MLGIIPTDWPGRPATVAGLAANLRPLLADVAELVKRYEDLLPPSRRPSRRTVKTPALELKLPPAVNVPTREGMVPRALAGFVDQLGAAAREIPEVYAACQVILAPPPPGEVRTSPPPLCIPDDAAGRVIDAGTGAPVESSPNGETYPGHALRWWPATPVGVALENCPLDAVITAGWRDAKDLLVIEPDWVAVLNCEPPDLAGYAAAVAALRRYQADYRATATALGRSQGARNASRTAVATAAGYSRWLRLLEPLGDRIAAAWVSRIHILRQGMNALAAIEGNTTMPALITTPPVIANLAQRIRDQITQGGGGRLEVSDSEQAFTWAGGLPVTLLSYLALASSGGRHIDTVTAKASAASNGSVAEGGAKPNGVDFTTAEVDLAKYANFATITTESAQFVSSIEQAVTAVLVTKILRGIEADAAARMTASAGVVIPAAADITAGVLEAIAAIASNGGSATVVGLSATDWVTVMSTTGSSGYLNFSNVEAGPRGTWLGLAPVIVPTLAAGTAVVADGTAVAVFEVPGGPLCVVDPYTELKNNKISIAIETWAAPNVNSPGGVAAVTVTGGAATSARSK